jgi:hypothetical protein
MASKRQAAKRLRIENTNGRTWRELSEQYGIPAGTLQRIAKSDGRYWPRKWAETLYHDFGVHPRNAIRRAASPRRISDMSPRALLWAFENRVPA